MEFVLEPINITRELILSRVSEETLMEHYAGAPCKKGLFVSKLRRDVRPTCAYYRSNKSGRLIYKDFGDNFAGDFVSVVMYKFNCSYYKALQIGDASKVIPIDKFSIVISIALAFIILKLFIKTYL